jgi:sensor domain CHASE-containing protein
METINDFLIISIALIDYFLDIFATPLATNFLLLALLVVLVLFWFDALKRLTEIVIYGDKINSLLSGTDGLGYDGNRYNVVQAIQEHVALQNDVQLETIQEWREFNKEASQLTGEFFRLLEEWKRESLASKP